MCPVAARPTCCVSRTLEICPTNFWNVIFGSYLPKCYDDVENKAGFRRHTETECRVLALIGGQFKAARMDPGSGPNPNLYNLVFPLRFALLKWTNLEVYSSLMRLESHLEQRRQEVVIQFCGIRIRIYGNVSGQGGPAYKSLVTMAKLISEALSDVDLVDAETMIAIQYTNSFEINATGMEGRALYPIISKINHSCIPNVAHCNTIFGESTTYHLNGSCEDIKGKIRITDVLRTRFLMQFKNGSCDQL